MDKINLKDFFKDYSKDLTLGAFMGMVESTKIMLMFAKTIEDREEFIKTMERVLNNLKKDLEEIKNESFR